MQPSKDTEKYEIFVDTFNKLKSIVDGIKFARTVEDVDNKLVEADQLMNSLVIHSQYAINDIHTILTERRSQISAKNIKSAFEE